MRIHAAPRALGLVCSMLAFAGVAAAQPAQIVYATQGGSNTQAPAPVAADSTVVPDNTSLVGGGDTSYGYGRQQSRRTPAMIDIRRQSTNAHVEEIAYQQAPADDADDDDAAPVTPPQAQPVQQAQATQAQSTEQGAQPWLERERVGPPYQANGQWYVPTPEPGYEQTGVASWYGQPANGQRTASGEAYDAAALTAAHPTLPIPSLVQVTNLDNGREVIVRVNDRGPFVGGRVIDVSQGAAQVLGITGTARVHVRYLGPAPRHVNADGSMAAASTQVPAQAPASVQAATQEGPASLLPPPAPRAAAQVQEAPLPAYTTPAVATSADGFFVQVGAFSELENAHRVRAELLSAGPVVVDTRQTANGELFRVRVGPYQSRAEADSARQAVAQLGYANAIIAAR